MSMRLYILVDASAIVGVYIYLRSCVFAWLPLFFARACTISCVCMRACLSVCTFECFRM